MAEKKSSGGKKKHKNKPTSKKYKFYTIDGEEVRRGKYCPRCGPGTFLAVGKSKDKERFYCGKCHYTEFLDKK